MRARALVVELPRQDFELAGLVRGVVENGPAPPGIVQPQLGRARARLGRDPLRQCVSFWG